jgi:hypothetical protein
VVAILSDSESEKSIERLRKEICSRNSGKPFRDYIQKLESSKKSGLKNNENPKK